MKLPRPVESELKSDEFYPLCRNYESVDQSGALHGPLKNLRQLRPGQIISLVIRSFYFSRVLVGLVRGRHSEEKKAKETHDIGQLKE